MDNGKIFHVKEGGGFNGTMYASLLKRGMHSKAGSIDWSSPKMI